MVRFFYWLVCTPSQHRFGCNMLKPFSRVFSFSGNKKVLDKQYLSLVKVALTFEIKTWRLIDYCGFWIACLMRDMQLTYGDVMWITVWEVLVVSYCKMIINDSTLYLMMLIISFSEELHLTRMCGLCEFKVAKPAVFNESQEIQRSGGSTQMVLQPGNSLWPPTGVVKNGTLFNGGIVTSQRLGIKKKVTNCITDRKIFLSSDNLFDWLQMIRYKLILGDEICNPHRRYEIVFALRWLKKTCHLRGW